MAKNKEFKNYLSRIEALSDQYRKEALSKRHQSGNRTARENLDHLVDEDSFIEFGAFAVAAQRSRKDYDSLQKETSADGVITGFCEINSDEIGKKNSNAVAIVYDYSVLAGTQGYFHHQKLDRIIDKAKKYRLPVVIFTEGGGGRPGDVDVSTQIAGLNVPTFSKWASLTGSSLRIAINNGYCFAGNAALFGAADFRIATKQSWIGMAGPAMIEGGGLGKFDPTEIGPSEMHEMNGTIDLLAKDEKEATTIAKKLLTYFQGNQQSFEASDQNQLRELIPEDRKWGYPIRDIIDVIADKESFLELKKNYGRSVVTGFFRLEGKPFALLASDCQQLGGAIDAVSAEKSSEFLTLCNEHGIPIVALVDTPGFMVGPESEEESAVTRMSKLFKVGSQLSVPLMAIFLRKAYGLGAMAMVGGSFHEPIYSASWPTGEFGGMGLEGAVQLGFKRELEAVKDQKEREALFDQLVASAYEKGKAIEAAAHLEIDAVIDPADTRKIILRAYNNHKRD
ncbi:MAG TPA: carboxyl transferase domain-containing protein [Gammaproteobacteria bacterium]|jgi:acetyl-CoA carboxylase carboxyltransferase component|nr:carboxyl transferase domain-containing protein [Gammaproteobacteria bacterium]HJN00189.1 carboxyl transferase domain-containing protein [Gammaproteobacteria bacterium]|tara:strand:- start:37631 stop:39154 length:1524 start_codon:yes stop_codon:yes gene_type:complete